MARRGGRDYNLFNFSFVDILATTIGVLIFIMVLVLLNSSTRLSPKGLEEQVKDWGEKWKEYQEEARATEEKTRQEKERKEAYEKTGGDRAAAVKDYEDQKKKGEALRAEAEKIKDEARRLKDEEDRLQKEAADSRPTPPNRTEVEFRVPKLRATTREPFTFECAGGRVYFLATYQGGVYERNYSVSSLGFAALIQRKPNAHGEDAAAALKAGSDFMNRLSQMNGARHFGNFIVRPDSFDLFRKLREVMWKRKFGINWRPYSQDDSIISGGAGGPPKEQ